MTPGSQEFYRRTREANEGKKLEDIRTEQHWVETEAAFRKMAAWYSMNEEGKQDWVMEEGICWADIQIASSLMWAKTALGADSKEWARFCSWDGGKWKRIVDNFVPYTYIDF